MRRRGSLSKELNVRRVNLSCTNSTSKTFSVHPRRTLLRPRLSQDLISCQNLMSLPDAPAREVAPPAAPREAFQPTIRFITEPERKGEGCEKSTSPFKQSVDHPNVNQSSPTLVKKERGGKSWERRLEKRVAVKEPAVITRRGNSSRRQRSRTAASVLSRLGRILPR